MVVEKRTFITALILILTATIGVVSNSTAVCRICVLLLFVLCILLGRHEKSILNPYYLFAFVPFSLLIYVKISSYHLVLNVNTWLIAIINITAFLFALMFTKPYKHYYKCIGVGEDRQYLTHIIILTAMGYFPTIYSILTGHTFFLASIFCLFIYPGLMVAMKSKNRTYNAITIALVLSTWIKYVSKTSVLSLAITILVGYERYYVDTPKKKRKLIILTIVGLLVMIAAFSFANQGRGSSSGFSGTTLEYYTEYGNANWSFSERLFMPYMYITTPWANLQYVMETQNIRTYGLWLLKPLLGYIQLDGIFTSTYSISAYSSFNTFTYIACCFKDFGLFGSSISSIILGFFVKKVYSRTLISKSPLDVACYALVAQAVLEMFFSNHFFTQSYPFTIVIIMGIYKMIFCKNNDADLDLDNEEVDQNVYNYHEK